MLFVFAFFIELFLLFLLSKSLTRHISLLFHRLTRSKRVTVYLLAILFLPGTIIHEAAHYLMAKLTLVPVGNMYIIPQLQGNDVILGSVSHARIDPIRRFLIGAAPFLFGTIIILSTLFATVQYDLLNNNLILILVGYIVFEVGNTMFSSKKDMEGSLELFLIIIVLLAVAYFLGIKPPSFSDTVQIQITQVFQKASFFVAIPLVVDSLIIVTLKLVNRLFY